MSSPTSLTDLLLSKLQVYETNERDLKDAAGLLIDCEIDCDYVATLLGRDWGWWRTVTEVSDRLREYSAQLPAQQRDAVVAQPSPMTSNTASSRVRTT